MWPWSTIRRGRAEARGYSDALTDLLVASAGGGDEPTGSAHLTAAVEACAGMWARAFASAEVEGDSFGVLTPGLLARVARSLIVAGESLHLIRVRGEDVRLIPSGSWDVFGDDPEPRGWVYRLQLDGPSGARTVTERHSGIVHVRYSDDPSRPWRGVGPMVRAGLSAELLSSLETRLRQEAGAPSAYVIPSPADGQETSTATLRSDVKAAKGGVVMAETMASGYGDQSGAPQRDWQQSRIGAHPPDVLRALRSDVGMAVCNACGVPAALLGGRSDGTLARESWRQFLHGSVAPVARIVEAEVSDKLDSAVKLEFTGLYASDVAGRAQAFQKLVAGGMAVPEALALSGLVAAE
ncbi:MAG: hypothetical protein OXU64_07575 [Gemmatimonadota bacterium]|nr:hypothetical protein [Gemmatimonadota bacterium]